MNERVVECVDGKMSGLEVGWLVVFLSSGRVMGGLMVFE